MNTGMRLYQSMQKAAKAVEEGKTGAKAKLAVATKKYVAHVEKTAKKDAADKVADAKKRAAAIGRAKPKAKAKAKSKTATARKRRTTASKTTKRR